MSDINDLAAMTKQFGDGEEVAPAETAPTDMMDSGFLSSPEAFNGPDLSKPEPVEEVKPDPVIEQEPATTAPEKKEYGSYQEYVDAGNDPELYQGPKAREKWNDLKERERQVKDERNQTNTMLEQMQTTMHKQEERYQDDQARQKIYYEEQMKKAKADDDLEQFEHAQLQHAAIPDRQETRQQSPEPPEVQQMRKSDPRLDHWSSSFDPQFNQQFEGQVNYLANDLQARNGGRELSSIERQHVLKTVQGQMGQQTEQQAAPNPNRQRPAPVKAPSVASARGADPLGKMSPETRTMYNDWNKGTVHQQNMAKTLMEKYK